MAAMNLRTLRIVALAALGGTLGCENSTAPRPSFDLVPLTGSTGTLTVTNTTTGSVPATNYTVRASGTVNGSPVSDQNLMSPNLSTTFNNAPPATYQVTLSAVPANCTVTSANPQSVRSEERRVGKECRSRW